MKKIISIILCAAMLLGVGLVTAVAASTSYSIYDLADYGYGQTHWTIDSKATVSPVVDGVIQKGEYTFEVKDLVVADDSKDDRFFCVDPKYLDIKKVSIYMSYDDEYIYLGVEVIESDPVEGGEHLTLRMSLDENDFTNDVSVECKYGDCSESAYAELVNCSPIEGGICYEMSVMRTVFADFYGLDEDEEINEFLIQIIVADDKDPNRKNYYPEVWFGCELPTNFKGQAGSGEAAEAEGKLWGYGDNGDRYPHVMTLADNPSGETTPADTTGKTSDGTDAGTPDKSGCGSSVAAVAVALVATLGTCTVFLNKRK